MAEEERHAVETPWHCKRLVETMAHLEKALTARVLREGSVFRLSADGLERTYQVEVGIVFWSLLAKLAHLEKILQQNSVYCVLLGGLVQKHQFYANHVVKASTTISTQELLNPTAHSVAKESTTLRTDVVLRAIATIVAQANTTTTKHHKQNQIVKAAVQESTTQPLDQQLRAHVLIVVLKPFLLHQHLKQVAIAKHVQQATINQTLVNKAAL
jgi:hypothetical protein